MFRNLNSFKLIVVDDDDDFQKQYYKSKKELKASPSYKETSLKLALRLQ